MGFYHTDGLFKRTQREVSVGRFRCRWFSKAVFGLNTGFGLNTPSKSGFKSRLVSLCGFLLLLSFTAWLGGDRANAQGEATSQVGQAKMHAVWFEPLPPRQNESRRLPRPIESVRGEFLEFTADSLRVSTPDEQKVVSIAARRIIWIEPQWDDEDARDGMVAFSSGKYSEALPRLQAALQKRPPVWQQQWLLAHLALAAHQVGKHAESLQLIGYLQRSNPPAFMYSLLPIQWTSRPLGAAVLQAARSVLDAEESALRLVAASWLLSAGGERELADSVLESLTRGSDSGEIAELAQVLRWKRVSIPKVSSLVPQWDEAVERLPVALQGGPLLTIADRLEASGDSGRAREYYWTVQLLYKKPLPLAENARQALAELEKIKP